MVRELQDFFRELRRRNQEQCCTICQLCHSCTVLLSKIVHEVLVGRHIQVPLRDKECHPILPRLEDMLGEHVQVCACSAIHHVWSATNQHTTCHHLLEQMEIDECFKFYKMNCNPLTSRCANMQNPFTMIEFQDPRCY